MLLDGLAALAATTVCVGCRARGPRLCPGCAAALAPGGSPPVPGLDRALAAYAYESAARDLVLALKLRRDRSAAAPLAAALRGLVLRRGLGAGVLTWVPGRPDDVRRRGYDHGAVLAEATAAALGLDCRPLLVRAAATRDQTSLGARQRWANLEGAFEASPCPSRVALVDDVVTTGATASACAGALRRGGATSVELLAACRSG